MMATAFCNAHARSTGQPCKAKALANGRCKNHGGLSTGPRTSAGRKAIAEATRKRMASGQRERALAGFYRWLAGGGRERLSNLGNAIYKGFSDRIAGARAGAYWGLRATLYTTLPIWESNEIEAATADPLM